jgi:hypothetical protein
MPLRGSERQRAWTSLCSKATAPGGNETQTRECNIEHTYGIYHVLKVLAIHDTKHVYNTKK